MSQPTLKEALNSLSIKNKNAGTWIGSSSLFSDSIISSFSPVNGSIIGTVTTTTDSQYEDAIISAHNSFLEWRNTPAPKRGDVVRVFGNKLRDKKEALGLLVSYEMGKSYQEGLGEVQEMIDICDFAVGLSRQLTGLTIKSERPDHFMMEQYHPIGIIGIISAFNFPVAVWAWNAALAWVCGNACVWKGSEKTPLCAIACQNIWNDVASEMNLPKGLSIIISGGRELGIKMSEDKRIPVMSATGSTKMGKDVGAKVASRLGRSILELGGNNAMIITNSADLKMTITAAVFGAVGTAGQRCTSTRRLIIHDSIYNQVCDDYADVTPKTERIKAIKKDPYLNALQVKFAYALTCHKSQGGQWNAVFVDQGYLNEDMIDQEYVRWLYTAITRATKELYLVNFHQRFFGS